jgi:hypothetical protein
VRVHEIDEMIMWLRSGKTIEVEMMPGVFRTLTRDDIEDLELARGIASTLEEGYKRLVEGSTKSVENQGSNPGT